MAWSAVPGRRRMSGPGRRNERTGSRDRAGRPVFDNTGLQLPGPRRNQDRRPAVPTACQRSAGHPLFRDRPARGSRSRAGTGWVCAKTAVAAASRIGTSGCAASQTSARTGYAAANSPSTGMRWQCGGGCGRIVTVTGRDAAEPPICRYCRDFRGSAGSQPARIWPGPVLTGHVPPRPAAPPAPVPPPPVLPPLRRELAPQQQCQGCGVPVTRRARLCQGCARAARAASSAQLRARILACRAQGMTWAMAARACGLSGPGAAFNAVFPPWARYKAGAFSRIVEAPEPAFWWTSVRPAARVRQLTA
jgi:hypothetical protein